MGGGTFLLGGIAKAFLPEDDKDYHSLLDVKVLELWELVTEQFDEVYTRVHQVSLEEEVRLLQGGAFIKEVEEVEVDDFHSNSYAIIGNFEHGADRE
ncbi:hypothetical protein COCNU_scaffold003487G000010 [Cocos nucifera]|nr:hypothetical protein [Cocos nucifera]